MPQDPGTYPDQQKPARAARYAATSHEGYHNFGRDRDRGQFEVFYADSTARQQGMEPGWYWWACFPGCLPDGEPSGPFATSKEAYDDAMEE